MRRLNILLSAAFMFCAFAAFAQPGDLPVDREPGKCYAKCLIADEYETVTEQVLVKPASQRTEVVPAQYETVTEQVEKAAASTRLVAVPAEYETVTEQVVVKPESSRLIAVPAEYETVTEQYLIAEASSRIERVPAQYETATERIEVKPATTKWVKRKADRNCLSADPNDCLVWCLVEVPAEYRTVTKQVRKGCTAGYTDSGDDCTRTVDIPAEYGTRTKRVVKTPATSRQETIPAEYKTITKRVVKTPATTREEVIPAEYQTITKRVVRTPATTREEAIPAEYTTLSKKQVKTPATTRTIEVPAEYQTITKRNLVKKGGFTEWREVLCSDKVTSYTIRSIQQALKDRGYEPGPLDNVLGVRTKAALTKFQKDNGLPVGQLDLETLRALGVQY